MAKVCLAVLQAHARNTILERPKPWRDESCLLAIALLQRDRPICAIQIKLGVPLLLSQGINTIRRTRKSTDQGFRECIEPPKIIDDPRSLTIRFWYQKQWVVPARVALLDNPILKQLFYLRYHNQPRGGVKRSIRDADWFCPFDQLNVHFHSLCHAGACIARRERIYLPTYQILELFCLRLVQMRQPLPAQIHIRRQTVDDLHIWWALEATCAWF